MSFSTIFRDTQAGSYGYLPGYSEDHFDEKGSGVIARALADAILRITPESGVRANGGRREAELHSPGRHGS